MKNQVSVTTLYHRSLFSNSYEASGSFEIVGTPTTNDLAGYTQKVHAVFVLQYKLLCTVL